VLLGLLLRSKLFSLAIESESQHTKVCLIGTSYASVIRLQGIDAR
jgi:hypothetical protein